MLKPLGDRVLLKAETEEEKTVGGIVLALSLIHISEPTRQSDESRMPSSA